VLVDIVESQYWKHLHCLHPPIVTFIHLSSNFVSNPQETHIIFTRWLMWQQRP
jgi:hypothetical protein